MLFPCSKIYSLNSKGQEYHYYGFKFPAAWLTMKNMKIETTQKIFSHPIVRQHHNATHFIQLSGVAKGGKGATAPWQKLSPLSPPNEITLCTEV